MSELQSISTKELRNNLAEILEKVAIGQQSFVVSKFGRKKALILPVNTKKVKAENADFGKLPACGMWKDRKDMKDSSKWVSDLRKRESLRKKQI